MAATMECALFLISFLATVLLTHGLPTEIPVKYDGETQLNEQGAWLKWRAIDGENIEFELRVPKYSGRLGWFGLGVTPTGGMRGADIAIGWIDEDGTAHLEDRHAEGNFEPELDQSQDWTLVKHQDSDDNIIFLIRRKLKTCDEQDVPINHETTRFIFASSPTPPQKTATGYRLRKHSDESKGLKSKFLFPSGQDAPTELRPEEKLSFLDFRTTRFALSTADTIYRNELIPWNMSANPQDLHMIGYEPVIEPGNEDIVHHMDTYFCSDSITKDWPPQRSWLMEEEGYGQSMQCAAFFSAWSKGGGPIYFPPNVAMALKDYMGGGYVMVQVHYDNAKREADRTDTSGIRAHVSNMPREHNAGSIRFGSSGMDWSTIVPPLQDNWLIRAECPQACLQQKLPPTGVRVVLAGPHTHLLGTRIIAHHIRDGKAMEPLIKDNNFDFNYQQYQAFENDKTILPGDRIVVDCQYSSLFPTYRNATTFGGYSTRDEMCNVFAYYYPAVDWSICESRMKRDKMIELLEYPEPLPSNIAENQRLMEWLSTTYNWTEENRVKLQKHYLEGPRQAGCFPRKIENMAAHHIQMERSDPFEPFVDPEETCNGSSSTSIGPVIFALALLFLAEFSN